MDIGIIMMIIGLIGLVVLTSILAFTNVHFPTSIGLEEYGTWGLALWLLRLAVFLSLFCGLFLLLIGHQRSEGAKKDPEAP